MLTLTLTLTLTTDPDPNHNPTPNPNPNPDPNPNPNPDPNPNPNPNPNQTGAVTAQMLKELFAVPLSTIPGHDPAIPPVRTRGAAPQPRVLEAATPC